jgi:hypothetical protein
MGIFDRFKGHSGNQAEEEQQDASQQTGGQFIEQTGQGVMQTAHNRFGLQVGPLDPNMGGYQDPNQPGYQDQNQGGYQDQNQAQNQGGYDPNQDQYGDQNQGQ